jgi:hypothetical protein
VILNHPPTGTVGYGKEHRSVKSIVFESDSYFTRIELFEFSSSSLQSLLVPSTIVLIASDATGIASQIRLIERNSCPEFTRWLELKG